MRRGDETAFETCMVFQEERWLAAKVLLGLGSVALSRCVTAHLPLIPDSLARMCFVWWLSF